MLPKIKTSVRYVLDKFGYQIKKLSANEYEELLNIQRYKRLHVSLLGEDFVIPDSLSFYYSYKEIFLNKIYKFESKNSEPKIIDCGANCGTSIVYFKNIYPNARITAIEPDPEIFKILKTNIKCRRYSNVELINKAVSAETKRVSFFREGADGGRIHALKNPKDIVKIETINLDKLVNEKIDFLKVDIEGAETEVICSSKYLKNALNIFIEYHSFKDASQNLGQLLDKLALNGFRYYIQTQFCSNYPLYKEKLQLGMDLQLNIFAKRIQEF